MLQNLGHIGARECVARKQHFRSLFRIQAADHIDRSGSTKIGTADAADNQRIILALQLCRELLNSVELFLVVIPGKVNPAKKIISRTGLLMDHVVDARHIRLIGEDILFQEPVFCIKANHLFFPPVPLLQPIPPDGRQWS